MKEIVAKCVGLIVLLLAPIKMLMFSVGLLVLIDLILGVWAAISRKEKVTSQGLKRTVTKTLVYQLAVIVAHIIDTQLVPGMGVLKIVSGLIAVTEVKSIFENLHTITGIDFWSAALHKLNTHLKYLPKDEDEKK